MIPDIGRVCPLVLLRTVILQWKLVWSTGGMTLTGGTGSTGTKTCHSATLSITSLTWTGLRSNPGLRGESPAADRLRHGTSVFKVRQWLAVCVGLWMLFYWLTRAQGTACYVAGFSRQSRSFACPTTTPSCRYLNVICMLCIPKTSWADPGLRAVCGRHVMWILGGPWPASL